MTYHMAHIYLSCTLSSTVCLYCRNLPVLPLLLCLWFHSKFQSHRRASICLQASAGDLSVLCSSLLCIYVRLCVGIGEVRAPTPKLMCLFAASISISTCATRLNSFCGVAIYYCSSVDTVWHPDFLHLCSNRTTDLFCQVARAERKSDIPPKISEEPGSSAIIIQSRIKRAKKTFSVFVSLRSYLLFCVFVRETIVIVLFRKVHPLRRCLQQVFKSRQLHSAEVCRTPRHHVKGLSEEVAGLFFFAMCTQLLLGVKKAAI